MGEAPARLTCGCGSAATRQVTASARTPFRWGESAGYFDRGLGCHVADHSARQRIMRERGLREVDDAEVQRHIDTTRSEAAEHDRQAAAFSSTLRATGGDVQAATEAAFPSPLE